MTAEDLALQLEAAECPVVIDVRSKLEYRSGHIPGALHVPFWGALLWQASLPNDKQRTVVLTCEHGPRAQAAAAQLTLLGYSRVVLLQGHMSGWRARGLPVSR
ncbi:MAG TPA: rhodanese-like domain-containing protein [Geothermobacteraceae bacterium]|nr:rhodanese-like domain-containing protein [Geothermobacteraceae bacterium]